METKPLVFPQLPMLGEASILLFSNLIEEVCDLFFRAFFRYLRRVLSIGYAESQPK
jgi:hypothetical protein